MYLNQYQIGDVVSGRLLWHEDREIPYLVFLQIRLSLPT